MALKDDRVEQCLRSCGSEIQMWGPKQTHTHTHIDCSRNWVLILVRMEILQEEEGFQFGFKR